MSTDWGAFEISADHDGAMSLDHDERACTTMWLTATTFTIAELMALAEEHLKDCPALHADESGPTPPLRSDESKG